MPYEIDPHTQNLMRQRIQKYFESPPRGPAEDYPCVLANTECVPSRMLLWCGWMCMHHAIQWALDTADPTHASSDILVKSDTRKLCQLCLTMQYRIDLAGDPRPGHKGEIICEDCALKVFEEMNELPLDEVMP